MQKFKENDLVEQKVTDAFNPVFQPTNSSLDTFYEEAYLAKPLGDVLKNSKNTPLAKAVNPQVFRDTFAQIFQSFTFTGTFRAYLFVLRAIFGDSVEVNFTVPAPGKLEIEVNATNLTLFDFVATEIEDTGYVFHEVVDHVGDNICFSSFLGFETQYELEQLFLEMVPQGVFTTVTLQQGDD